MNSLLQSPVWIFCLLVVSLTIIVAVGGLWLRMLFFPEKHFSDQDTANINMYFRLMGTLFTVLLAFVVVSVWQDYEEQRRRTALEASSLGNLYRDLRGLDDDFEQEVQKLVVVYTNDVVTDGWDQMAQGKESRKAWMSFNVLYGKVIRFSPQNLREQELYSRLIAHLNELAKYRRLRVIRNMNPGVPPSMWGILISAGMLTLVFSYFIKVNKRSVHMVMTTFVSIMFGLIFALIILLNYPYRSSIRVSSAPLENLLDDVFPAAEITEIESLGGGSL
jgi:hypothetical protein